MGRYSALLAPQLADLAGVDSRQRVLDVGCGPGALTSELVDRVGASKVVAVDPSEQFVAAARERHPGVDVRRAAAEELPFADGEFDATLAQLVVHFLADPVRGLAEMARVTHAGGITPASRRRWVRSGKPSTRSTLPQRTNRAWRALAKATWPSSSSRRGCARWRRPRFRFVSSTRASRSGGSPSPSAWAPPALT